MMDLGGVAPAALPPFTPAFGSKVPPALSLGASLLGLGVRLPLYQEERHALGTAFFLMELRGVEPLSEIVPV